MERCCQVLSAVGGGTGSFLYDMATKAVCTTRVARVVLPPGVVGEPSVQRAAGRWAACGWGRSRKTSNYATASVGYVGGWGGLGWQGLKPRILWQTSTTWRVWLV